MPPSPTSRRDRVGLSDAIIVALAGLIDDAGASREPSHNDLDFQVERAGLKAADPRCQGQTVGKAKRVRAILFWAIENDQEKGEVFAAAFLAMIRGKGGFREGAPNFVGIDAIADARAAFLQDGYVLGSDGTVTLSNLDTLDGTALTAALEAYVRRARRGSEDAALLVGTAKDLLEATAAHVLMERYGQYQTNSNFPTLLGQAFTALGLATPMTPQQPGESPQKRLERSLYEAGCAVNAMRNKQGTGHGRPWLPTISDLEAKSAVQLIGIVSGFLLAAHKSRQ